MCAVGCGMVSDFAPLSVETQGRNSFDLVPKFLSLNKFVLKCCASTCFLFLLGTLLSCTLCVVRN